jgi:hypothetical protein
MLTLPPADLGKTPHSTFRVLTFQCPRLRQMRMCSPPLPQHPDKHRRESPVLLGEACPNSAGGPDSWRLEPVARWRHYRELRNRGREAQLSLLPFVGTSDIDARAWVATHALGFSPTYGEPALKSWLSDRTCPGSRRR